MSLLELPALGAPPHTARGTTPQHQPGHAPCTLRSPRASGQRRASPRRPPNHFARRKSAHSRRRHAQAHYLDMSSKPTQDDALNALMGAAAAKFEAHGNPAGATFARYGITQNHYRAMSSEVLDNPRLRGLMGDMADQLEADGCTEEAALLRDPLSPEEAREMNTAFSKLNEVFDSKKALAKKANGKTEVANSMLCDLYERVKSWEGPGAGLAALIARSKFGAAHIDMTDKLFGEMRRLINLDEKAVEEELRKLGVTLDLVEPAAVGTKSKKPTKRKSREVIEIRDSSSDDEDEKPSPAKKAKAADPEEDAELICRPRTTGKKP